MAIAGEGTRCGARRNVSLTRHSGRDETLAVYVHWPFCAQKCPYCDFNSHVRHGGWDEARYLAAYLRELDHVARVLEPEGRRVTSVFFGGGTPSLMQPSTVAGILDHIARIWNVEPDAEITLEANPNSVEAARFAGYRHAGVNRVSIGVQSLRDDDLKQLGRLHDAAEARAAIELAACTFQRYSFDLIYARPGQTCAAWEAELSEALTLAGSHLSLYQLTIEPGTPFANLHARGRLTIPDGEAALALYELTDAMTRQAGLPLYEISNYARPGEESRHNLTYWRYGAYAGVGPGAHGRLHIKGECFATDTERQPEAWARLVSDQGHGMTGFSRLTPAEKADETLLMGLRLTEGLDFENLAARTGFVPSASVVEALVRSGLIEPLHEDAGDAEDDIIRACIGPGLAGTRATALDRNLKRVRATSAGRFVLDEIVRRLSLGLEPVSTVRSERQGLEVLKDR